MSEAELLTVLLIAAAGWAASALLAAVLAGRQALDISILGMLLLLGPTGLGYVIYLRFIR